MSKKNLKLETEVRRRAKELGVSVLRHKGLIHIDAPTDHIFTAVKTDGKMLKLDEGMGWYEAMKLLVGGISFVGPGYAEARRREVSEKLWSILNGREL